MKFLISALALACLVVFPSCGDETEADRLGIGAQCTTNADCLEDDGQVCLQQFKGGYCGVSGCTVDADCPSTSACVTHDDNVNYCFRTCSSKSECNANRDAANESNCSGSITWADTDAGKACVPPSN